MNRPKLSTLDSSFLSPTGRHETLDKENLMLKKQIKVLESTLQTLSITPKRSKLASKFLSPNDRTIDSENPYAETTLDQMLDQTYLNSKTPNIGPYKERIANMRNYLRRIEEKHDTKRKAFQEIDQNQPDSQKSKENFYENLVTLNRQFPLRRIDSNEDNLDLSIVANQTRPWIESYNNRKERLRSIEQKSIYEPTILQSSPVHRYDTLQLKQVDYIQPTRSITPYSPIKQVQRRSSSKQRSRKASVTSKKSSKQASPIRSRPASRVYEIQPSPKVEKKMQKTPQTQSRRGSKVSKRQSIDVGLIMGELSKLRVENDELKKLILSKDTSSTDVSNRSSKVQKQLNHTSIINTKSHSKKPSIKKETQKVKEITLKKPFKKTNALRTIIKQQPETKERRLLTSTTVKKRRKQEQVYHLNHSITDENKTCKSVTKKKTPSNKKFGNDLELRKQSKKRLGIDTSPINPRDLSPYFKNVSNSSSAKNKTIPTRNYKQQLTSTTESIRGQNSHRSAERIVNIQLGRKEQKSHF